MTMRAIKVHTGYRLTCRANVVVPEGHPENSPAFQRWDQDEASSRPEGTAEIVPPGRPFGTDTIHAEYPGVETPGYSRSSLRDDVNGRLIHCFRCPNSAVTVWK